MSDTRARYTGPVLTLDEDTATLHLIGLEGDYFTADPRITFYRNRRTATVDLGPVHDFEVSTRIKWHKRTKPLSFTRQGADIPVTVHLDNDEGLLAEAIAEAIKAGKWLPVAEAKDDANVDYRAVRAGDRAQIQARTESLRYHIYAWQMWTE